MSTDWRGWRYVPKEPLGYTNPPKIRPTVAERKEGDDMAGEKKDVLPAGTLYALALEVRRLEEENRVVSRQWREAQQRLDDACGFGDPPDDTADDEERQEPSAVVLAGPEGTFVVVNDLYSATVYPAVIRTVDGV